MFSFLESRWQRLLRSPWANRWLPEVRYFEGWNLYEVGTAVFILILTSSWYTIRTDRKRREQLEESIEQQDDQETQETQQEESDDLRLAKATTAKEPQKINTDGTTKTAVSHWSSPSLLDYEHLHHKLLSLPKSSHEMTQSLGFSVVSSWERRYHTLAMFSCSLAFVMPSTSLCAAVVVHFGILLPYHVFVSGEYSTENYTSFFEGILPDWYHAVYVAVVAGCIWWYLVWMMLWDDAPNSGSRVPWIRNKFGNWWNHACDYLPVLLIKTADLPAYTTTSSQTERGTPGKMQTTITTTTPNRYVLGYHPHGIIAVGAFCAFATDGARVLDLSKQQKDNDDGNSDKSDNNDSGSGIPNWLPLRASFVNLLDNSERTPIPLSEEEDNDDGSQIKEEKEPAAAVKADSASSYTPPTRGFSSLFPNLDRRIVTLPINFKTPFLREYLLAMGAVTSEKSTFRQFLGGHKGKRRRRAPPHPKAIIVVVGGAAESMLAHEGHIELVLKHRRGFVREAILANASLVPVLGFGETNLYTLYDEFGGVDERSSSSASSSDSNNTNKEGMTSTVLSMVQKFCRERFGVAVPLFTGRSVFFKSLGVMPRRRPVVVVVGKPIPPPTLKDLHIDYWHQFQPRIDRETDHPSNEHGRILMGWHSKYVHALEKLYEEYKDAPWNGPGKRRQKSLRIVQ